MDPASTEFRALLSRAPILVSWSRVPCIRPPWRSCP